MNWYVYCGNNPVAFVDPSGLGYLDSKGVMHYDNWEYLTVDPNYVSSSASFQRAPVGSGTSENDAKILNSEGQMMINRLQSIYDLAEQENNTLVMDAVQHEMVQIRVNRNYHKDNIDESLHSIYSRKNYKDVYPYSSDDHLYRISFDYWEYGSISAGWENGSLLNGIGTIFSAASELGDVQFGTYIIPVGTIGSWGDAATTAVQNMTNPIQVNSGDMKITVNISGLPGKSVEFYFRENSSNWFETDNTNALK